MKIFVQKCRQFFKRNFCNIQCNMKASVGDSNLLDSNTWFTLWDISVSFTTHLFIHSLVFYTTPNTDSLCSTLKKSERETNLFRAQFSKLHQVIFMQPFRVWTRQLKECTYTHQMVFTKHIKSTIRAGGSMLHPRALVPWLSKPWWVRPGPSCSLHWLQTEHLPQAQSPRRTVQVPKSERRIAPL